MTDNNTAKSKNMIPVAIGFVVVALIAGGIYLYHKKQDQKVFSMTIGGQTISATVTK